MHNGPLVMLRMLLLYARPWQQIVVCAICLAIGITLIALGHPAGIIAIIFGVFFSLPTLSKPVYKAWRTVRRTALPQSNTQDGSL